MLKKHISILLSLACILSSMLFVTPSHAAGNVIDVGQQSGNGYEYVGTTSAVIQQAVEAAGENDIIYIHAGTYSMGTPIILKSNISIKGDKGATILKGDADDCASGPEAAYLSCQGTSTAYIQNIDISGITFTSDATSNLDGGRSSLGRNCIFIRYCNDVAVHDCSTTGWIYLDFFRASSCTNLAMYKCNVVTGHAAASYTKCSNSTVEECNITVYTNAAVRNYDSTNCVYHNNTIWWEEQSGQAAFELQVNCQGANMYKNIIYSTESRTNLYLIENNASGGGAFGTVNFDHNVYWNLPSGIKATANGKTVTVNKQEDAGEGKTTDQNVANWIIAGYGAETETTKHNPFYPARDFSSQQGLGTDNTGTAVTINFDLTPLYSNTLGYVGYADSSTTLDAYSDMPIILRMYNGYFYAIKGSLYSRLAAVPYSMNTSYHVKIVADMPAKTYDLYITPGGGSQIQLANDFAFRSDAPATDDVGKVCFKTDTTNINDFKVENHKMGNGSTPPPPASQPVTFNPTADSYVRGGSDASCNFGDCPELVVKYEPDTGLSYFRKSYLKFNYSSLSSVTSAKLRVYLSASDGDASTIKVYGNSTESWSESTITWNNAPAATTSIGSINVGTTAGQWYEIDVTSYVNSNMSDKIISLELINEGPHADGNKATFNSKEASSNKPELVITP